MACAGDCEPRSLSKPLDLRPRLPVRRQIQHVLDRRPESLLETVSLEEPKKLYTGPAPLRDSNTLFSAVIPRLKAGASLLDLGCGPRDQAIVASHLGMRYVGIDYDSPAADVLADGHSLPFRNATFDVVLAYAVPEHFQDPFIAIAEVGRTLVPGGLFVGAVSQGEPFHSSFFHMTAWAVLSLLHQ